MKDIKYECKFKEKIIKVRGLYKLDVVIEIHQALLFKTMLKEELWNLKRYLNFKGIILLQIKDIVKGGLL